MTWGGENDNNKNPRVPEIELIDYYVLHYFLLFHFFFYALRKEGLLTGFNWMNEV